MLLAGFAVRYLRLLLGPYPGWLSVGRPLSGGLGRGGIHRRENDVKANHSRKLLRRSIALAVALLVSALGPAPSVGATTVPGGGGAIGTVAYASYLGRSGSTLRFGFTLESGHQWRMIGISYYIQRDGGGQPEKSWGGQRFCEPLGSTVSSCSFVISITDVPGSESYLYAVDGEGNDTFTSNWGSPLGSGFSPIGDTCGDGIDCALAKTVVQ